MPRYSHIAIFLHWTIAALLAFQISVGSALEGLGARGFALFQLHKSVGISILVLTLIRIMVRYWKPRPAPVEGGWQGTLAKAVHGGLYLFMLGAPLTGWALVSTARVKVPTLLFGILPLPHLPLPASAHEWAETGHALLAWIGIALFLLHVAGALRHHLLLRDGLLWRMIPVRTPVLLALLPALIVAGAVLGRMILPAPAPKAQAAAPLPAEPAAVEQEAPTDMALATNSAAPAPAENATAAEEESAPLPPPPGWTVQPGGRIGFSVDNGGEAISGQFAKWNATIVMDPDHPDSADLRVEIDLTSASVGDAYQDGMLAGEEFFATALHPKALFTASGAEKTGPNSYRASGTLSLKGVSRPQAIRFSLSGSGKSRKVSGSATIPRMPFAIGTGESGAGLAPKVAVNFTFDARAD